MSDEIEKFEAEDARKLARDSKKISGEVRSVLALIRSEALSGGRSITCAFLSGPDADLLREKGFSVRRFSGPREEDCYTQIYW